MAALEWSAQEIMEAWQDELFALLTEGTADEARIRQCLEKATQTLGFQYFSVGYQQTLPMNRPRLSWLSNYPESWTRQYLESNFLFIDPRIQRARQSSHPFLWDEALFADAPELWKRLKQQGLENGLTLSVLDSPGGISMLSLVGPDEKRLPTDDEPKLQDLQILARCIHSLVANLTREKSAAAFDELTEREIEVLKWSADGKSAQDIADILGISCNTVNFHIKNIVQKLHAPNKTVAVVRAVLLGLLKDRDRAENPGPHGF